MTHFGWLPDPFGSIWNDHGNAFPKSICIAKWVRMNRFVQKMFRNLTEYLCSLSGNKPELYNWLLFHVLHYTARNHSWGKHLLAWGIFRHDPWGRNHFDHLRWDHHHSSNMYERSKTTPGLQSFKKRGGACGILYLLGVEIKWNSFMYCFICSKGAVLFSVVWFLSASIIKISVLNTSSNKLLHTYLLADLSKA